MSAKGFGRSNPNVLSRPPERGEWSVEGLNPLFARLIETAVRLSAREESGPSFAEAQSGRLDRPRNVVTPRGFVGDELEHRRGARALHRWLRQSKDAGGCENPPVMYGRTGANACVSVILKCIPVGRDIWFKVRKAIQFASCSR